MLRWKLGCSSTWQLVIGITGTLGLHSLSVFVCLLSYSALKALEATGQDQPRGSKTLKIFSQWLLDDSLQVAINILPCDYPGAVTGGQHWGPLPSQLGFVSLERIAVLLS